MLNKLVSSPFTPFPADSIPLCTHQERVRALEQQCQRLGLNNHSEEAKIEAYSKLLCDDRRGLLWLGFAKIASSSLLQALLTIDGKRPKGDLHQARVQRDYGLKKLNLESYTKEEILYRIQNYYTFTVVRNPFDRLVSAWRNKLIKPSAAMYGGISRSIAKTYPRYEFYNATGSIIGLPPDRATFPQFATYLRMTPRRKLDAHWVNYSSFNPCIIKWSAILKMETLQIDAYPLLERLKKDNVTELPSRNALQEQNQRNLTFKRLPEFQGVLPEDYEYLFKIYGLDFDLFGYSWDSENMAAACKCQPSSDYVCC